MVGLDELGAVVARFGTTLMALEQRALAQTGKAGDYASGYRLNAAGSLRSWPMPSSVVSIRDIGAVVAQFGQSCR